MRVVLQRVLSSSVEVEHVVVGEIGVGILVLVGIEDSDTEEDIKWLASKIVNLRVFNDENGVMNCSVLDINGDLLVISQFTLHAATKKGNRPSYIRASKPEFANAMYERFLLVCKEQMGKPIQAGRFGADMKVKLVNDGPVTIIIDSKNKDF